MVVATWNINGLRSYQKEFDLKEFLEDRRLMSQIFRKQS